MSKKFPTNEDMFKSLFKELDSVEVALLRERVMFVSELTCKSIKEEPEKWNKSFVSPHLYLKMHEKIEKHLGFGKDKS